MLSEIKQKLRVAGADNGGVEREYRECKAD